VIKAQGAIFRALIPRQPKRTFNEVVTPERCYVRTRRSESTARSPLKHIHPPLEGGSRYLQRLRSNSGAAAQHERKRFFGEGSSTSVEASPLSGICSPAISADREFQPPSKGGSIRTNAHEAT
jgi:hypothetical protein